MAVTTGAALATSGVYGGYAVPCEPIYGGGQTCISKGNIVLNKTVQNPTTNAFVDNLSLSNDPKFVANQDVTFQLTLVNSGDKNLSEVSVTDTFPSYINFVSGPGTFDSNTKNLTFKVFNLGAGESRTYTIKARVVSSLPTDPAVNCVVNQAKAVSDSNEASDVSQVCLQNTVTTKGGFPVLGTPTVKQTPATGPEMLPLFGLIPAGLGGLFLRRKASK